MGRLLGMVLRLGAREATPGNYFLSGLQGKQSPPEAIPRGKREGRVSAIIHRMGTETLLLLVSAVSVGFLHTVLGPDHYVPFVAMARVGGWSRRKALVITALCGVGHVTGSVILGLVGIAFGLSLTRLEAFESSRGSIAAWGLILFGLLYGVWGLRRAVRGHRHSHLHAHADGTLHVHTHIHAQEHLHPHGKRRFGPSVQIPAAPGLDLAQPSAADPHVAEPSAAEPSGMTPWVLFVIFLFGPCEALIPLLMFPAATESWGALLLVSGTFGLVTVGTMMAVVSASLEGLHRLSFPRAERFSHAFAGATILLCGIAIRFLGL